MKHPLLYILSVLLLFCSFTTDAQVRKDPVDFRVVDTVDEVEAGGVVHIILQADIQKNWHLYSINNDSQDGPAPTKFTLVGGGAGIAGEIEESDPVIEYDRNFDTELGWHDNSAEFRIPVRFTSDAPAQRRLKIEIRYQACTDDFCLPPQTKTVEHSIRVD